MLKVSEIPDPEYHRIIKFEDEAYDLCGYIAIHSVELGPAVGGCRCWIYPDSDSALRDAKKLAKGMSYKAAAANLPYGGGKAVIMMPEHGKTKELMRAFGGAVGFLRGEYYTGVDVGTTPEDMLEIFKSTEYTLDIGANERPRNSGYYTALGVFESIKSLLLEKKPFTDISVAVQGLGSVGWNLCRLLHNAGLEKNTIYVTDIDNEKIKNAISEFRAVADTPDMIMTHKCDVFSPCALGGVIDGVNIYDLKVDYICGAANNQLAGDEARNVLLAKELKRQRILYCPDFVVNAGGLICVVDELGGQKFDEDRVISRINDIPKTLNFIVEESKRVDSTPQEVAVSLAKERMNKN